MKKHLLLGLIACKELIYYPYQLLSKQLIFYVLVFVLTNLVVFAAQQKGIDSIGGIAITNYIRYVFATELLMVHRRNPLVDNYVQSGHIITLLNKPIHFIGLLLTELFWSNLIKIASTSSCAGIVIYLIHGSFSPLTRTQRPLFVASFLVGILLLSLVNILLGLGAFVFENSSFLRLFINKMYFIFGGLFFPITIYPQRLQNISQALPFQYYMYSPAKFFATGDTTFFLAYFPYQLLRLCLTLSFIYYCYTRLARRMEINGG